MKACCCLSSALWAWILWSKVIFSCSAVATRNSKRPRSMTALSTFFDSLLSFLETGDLLLESLAGDFEVVLQHLLLDVELLLKIGDLGLQIRLLLGQGSFGAVGIGRSRLQHGEVGLESGDLLSEGNILLLELRLEGSLSISLIVQGLELLLSDFGHFSVLSLVCS